MAVKCRLARIGKRSAPEYRIVIIDSQKKRSGRQLEIVGYYKPVQNPPVVKLEKDRIEFWVKQGAILSDTVKKLLK